jgi:predicted P-loop ATPase
MNTLQVGRIETPPKDFSDDQRSRLEHIGQHVPGWFQWRPGYGSGKAPLDPRSSKPAAVNDPSTAGTLVDALRKIPAGGGVGVLLSTAPVDWVCIDLDHVIRDGQLHELGARAVELFEATYLEVSPSGTGLRAFAVGTVQWHDPDAEIIGPLTVGHWPDGEAVKFEIYRNQPVKWARMTGCVVDGTAGAVGPASEGLDWVGATMASAMPKRTASGSIRKDGGLPELFAQLADMRGGPDNDEEANPAVIADEIRARVAMNPRAKLAVAWKGGGGDASAADFAVCCEALRRGADSLAAVVGVWAESPASKRDKFERADYRESTVRRALREVLDRPPKEWRAAQDEPETRVSPDVVNAVTAGGGELIYKRAGQLAAEAGNVLLLFRFDARLRGLIGFNELSQTAERLSSWKLFDDHANECPGAIEEDDYTRVSVWLVREYGMHFDKRELAQVLDAAARDARYDPLKERLLELRDAWDGVPRVSSWLTTYLKVDDTGCAQYVSTAGACFLVGAVARAMQPGCKHDTVLSLEGGFNAGKSSACEVLADAIAPDLFCDGVRDVSDSALLVEDAGGRFIVELAELAAVRRASDVEALKAALTRRRDTCRRPYAMLPQTHERRFVFVGTSNAIDYRGDVSGALLRRFWPVKTTATEASPIDLQTLRAIAAQLWGEAVALYQQDHRWWIGREDGPAYEQWVGGREARREDGAYHDDVVEFLTSDAAGGGPWPMKDIAKAIGDTRSAEGDQASMNRLADTLRGIGMVSKKLSNGRKAWFLSAETIQHIDGWKRAA